MYVLTCTVRVLLFLFCGSELEQGLLIQQLHRVLWVCLLRLRGSELVARVRIVRSRRRQGRARAPAKNDQSQPRAFQHNDVVFREEQFLMIKVLRIM